MEEKQTKGQKRAQRREKQIKSKNVDKASPRILGYISLEGDHSIAENKISKSQPKAENGRQNVTDKSENASVEQVMDPRTRMTLFKFLTKGLITEIDACISLGKEANIYHAMNDDGKEFAVKVYKISIPKFKDGDCDISGDQRSHQEFVKGDPGKMLRILAEKETSNLNLLHDRGVPVPCPVILRPPVLIMEFLGRKGIPAQKLKDADISKSKAQELYYDLVKQMWIMYRECRLVHANLNEFNILYYEGRPYIIGISQSVTPDHSNSLIFLRKDCTNVTEYFRKKNVLTLTIKELFNFLVDQTITNENKEKRLEKLQEVASARSMWGITSQEKLDEEVFKQTHLPNTLYQVTDFEQDHDQGNSGNKPEDNATSLSENLSKIKLTDSDSNSNLSGEDEDEEVIESQESDDNRSTITPSFGPINRPREESSSSRKERKKAMRAERAEKKKNAVLKRVERKKKRK